MALLLGMITPLGWLERVPTYKERLRDMAERDIANFGLLGYPLLQTVDITIVRGALVPVGEDQVSHLEISREIVRRFNRLYGDVLLEPQALLSEWPMIPGSDGRKMSKSLDNTIDLDDDPDTIRAKVRSFITDPQKVASRRPRPARDLSDIRLAPQVLSGHPGVDRRALPHGRAGVRGLQDEPGRPHHRAARAVPRTTCGAGREARSRLRRARRGGGQGATGRGSDDGGRAGRDAFRMSDAGAVPSGKLRRRPAGLHRAVPTARRADHGAEGGRVRYRRRDGHRRDTSRTRRRRTRGTWRRRRGSWRSAPCSWS